MTEKLTEFRKLGDALDAFSSDWHMALVDLDPVVRNRITLRAHPTTTPAGAKLLGMLLFARQLELLFEFEDSRARVREAALMEALVTLFGSNHGRYRKEFFSKPSR